VVRLSTRARQQVFLSGDSAIYSEWLVAGGNDGEENAAGGKLSNTMPKKHEKYQIFTSSDIATLSCWAQQPPLARSRRAV
jgi:hypothetical protein